MTEALSERPDIETEERYIQRRRDELESAFAAKHYEQALEIVGAIQQAVPGDFDSRFKGARCLWMLHRHEPAMDGIRELIAEYPANDQLYWTAGDIQADLGNAKEAIDLLERAVELNPDFYYYHIRLSEELYNLLMTLPAIAHTRRFTREFIPEYLQMANRALEEACIAVEMRPDLSSGHSAKAAVLSLLLRYEEALECYRTAIVCEPQDARARASHADLLMRLGYLKEAREEADYALSLDSGLRETRQLRELIEEGERNPKVLHDYWLSHATFGTSEYLSTPAAMKRLILLKLKTGERPMKLMRVYLKGMSDDAEIRLAYGKTLYDARQYDRAMKYFRRQLRRYEGDVELRRWVDELDKMSAWKRSVAPVIRRTASGIGMTIFSILFSPVFFFALFKQLFGRKVKTG
ncbi:tetratricopeptide repeat protein [Saccharibacillus alkalitolerans]|uniref:Tetratricopeptide repeat protein n=1 Tax=Saccharibacillus alkalitolerans TaxID=2705290 RepID=A0ABX0F5Y9_9BACL|nr:tetratricopeptide repeat protein [Saccharibacillus alkalitolerans]NGZ75778.1 tetratricopeptide repeat protein [Saccharibacillus alkalitolerans]